MEQKSHRQPRSTVVLKLNSKKVSKDNVFAKSSQQDKSRKHNLTSDRVSSGSEENLSKDVHEKKRITSKSNTASEDRSANKQKHKKEKRRHEEPNVINASGEDHRDDDDYETKRKHRRKEKDKHYSDSGDEQSQKKHKQRRREESSSRKITTSHNKEESEKKAKRHQYSPHFERRHQSREKISSKNLPKESKSKQEVKESRRLHSRQDKNIDSSSGQKYRGTEPSVSTSNRKGTRENSNYSITNSPHDHHHHHSTKRTKSRYDSISSSSTIHTTKSSQKPSVIPSRDVSISPKKDVDNHPARVSRHQQQQNRSSSSSSELSPRNRVLSDASKKTIENEQNSKTRSRSPISSESSLSSSRRNSKKAPQIYSSPPPSLPHPPVSTTSVPEATAATAVVVGAIGATGVVGGGGVHVPKGRVWDEIITKFEDVSVTAFDECVSPEKSDGAVATESSQQPTTTTATTIEVEPSAADQAESEDDLDVMGSEHWDFEEANQLLQQRNGEKSSEIDNATVESAEKTEEINKSVKKPWFHCDVLQALQVPWNDLVKESQRLANQQKVDIERDSVPVHALVQHCGGALSQRFAGDEIYKRIKMHFGENIEGQSKKSEICACLQLQANAALRRRENVFSNFGCHSSLLCARRDWEIRQIVNETLL